MTSLSKNIEVMQVAKLSDRGIIPTKGSKQSAGFDLYSAQNCLIPAGGKALVNTDIQVKVPQGTYGRIAPRSGLAWKHQLAVAAGVVDADYRGNIGTFKFFILIYQHRCCHIQPCRCRL